MQNLNDNNNNYDPREDQEAQRLQREEALRALEELRGETVAQSAAQSEQQQQTAVQPEQQSPVQTEQTQPKQADQRADKPDTPAVADSVTERQSQHDFLVRHGVAKPPTVSDRSVRQKTQVRAVRLADQIQANRRSTKRALSQKKDENVTKAMKM